MSPDPKHLKRQAAETTPPLPAPPTLLPSADIYSFLSDLREDVRDVKTALRGDSFGNPGMVENLQTLTRNHQDHIKDDDRRFTDLERKMIYWGGIVAGVVGSAEIYILLYK